MRHRGEGHNVNNNDNATVAADGGTTSTCAISPCQKINNHPLKLVVVMERWQKGRQNGNGRPTMDNRQWTTMMTTTSNSVQEREVGNGDGNGRQSTTEMAVMRVRGNDGGNKEE